MLLEPKLIEMLTVMTFMGTAFGLFAASLIISGPNSARQRLKDSLIALFCGIFVVIVGPFALIWCTYIGIYRFIKDLYNDN